MKKMILAAVISATILSGCAVSPSQQYGYQQSYNHPIPVQHVSNGNVMYVSPGGYVVTSRPQPIQYTQDFRYKQPQQVYVQPQPQYRQAYQQPNPNQYGYQQQQVYVQPQPQYRQQNNVGGQIIGTVAGGLIGSQVGQGNGKVAAAAVGGAIGGMVGSGCRTINGGQVLGALAGGLIGSNIGGGNGRIAAATIGSSIGAQVGNDMAGGCN
jgi:uncharacterized protein YcfJ